MFLYILSFVLICAGCGIAVAQAPSPQTSVILQSRVLLSISNNKSLDSTFQIRRANVTIKGNLDEHLRALVTINCSAEPYLNEAYAEYTRLSWQARLGLVRLPFGYEMPLSSAKVIPLERAKVITSLFSSKRDYDRGLFVYHTGDTRQIAVAVTNGANVGTTADIDANKAIAARVSQQVGAVNIGISGYTGTYAATGKRMSRLGTDLQLPLASWLLLAEAIAGRDGDTDGGGGYLLLCYQQSGCPMQYYGRYDLYDPNNDAEDDRYCCVAIGANRYSTAAVKITLEYDIIDDPKTPALDGQLGFQWQICY